MFWALWLPLIFLCVCTIIGIIIAIVNKSADPFGYGFLIGVIIAFFAFLFGMAGNSSKAESNLKSVYADMENPVYIVTIPGNEEGQKYLIYNEDITHGGVYSYYYINPASNNPEYASIVAAEIRFVYDSPPKPFYAMIKATCKAKRLWVLTCTNPSPYRLEFHLPSDSILKY